jgi:DNA helicase-2/ATP-dependent DNA helicase PcrA
MKVRRPKLDYNKAQKQAIAWKDGPVDVSAGPGSGKTRVIVARIGELIKNHVDPRSILATTFTKKAADEMNDRLHVDGVNTDSMSVQTMHSFCYRILREEGYDDWDVDDSNKYNLILKRVIGFQSMRWTNADLSLIESFISLAKNGLIRPEQSDSWSVFQQAPYLGDNRYVQAYFEAEEIRRHRKILTFDDMLIDGVETLEGNSRILNRLQDKYQYVIVDEFQDSNLAQVKLMELVAHPQWNLMVVGDVDQAIYEWRGAIPKFMIDFPTKHNAKVISMGTNYRCAPNIMDAAANCIAHNKHRDTKDLTANKEAPGQITIKSAEDLDEEANIVADEIQQLKNDGVPTGSMFVLYRINAQSRAIEEVFSNRKIPHVVLGSVSFYQRKEIQDLLSYLKLIIDPNDDDAGSRAINRPFRFISRAEVDNMRRIAGSKPTSFIEAAMEVANSNPRISNKIYDFVQIIQSLSSKYERRDEPGIPDHEKWTVGNFISEILEQTRYLDYLANNEGSDTAENSREANVGEFVRSADRYKNISEFLQFVKEQIEERKRRKKKITNAVTCMTIHRAKGLEASAVFVIGANEGIIPHIKSTEPHEEERRLFYVGMTRAMDHLHITYVRRLGVNAIALDPSRFIKEAKLPYDDSKDLTPNLAGTNMPSLAGGQVNEDTK